MIHKLRSTWDSQVNWNSYNDLITNNISLKLASFITVNMISAQVPRSDWLVVLASHKSHIITDLLTLDHNLSASTSPQVGFLKTQHRYEIVFTLPEMPELGKDVCPAPIPNPHLRITNITPSSDGTSIARGSALCCVAYCRDFPKNQTPLTYNISFPIFKFALPVQIL